MGGRGGRQKGDVCQEESRRGGGEDEGNVLDWRRTNRI